MSGQHPTPYLLLLVALASSWQMVSSTTCTLPAPAHRTLQRPVVSNQFTVHVEATFVDKNKTMQFIEYYDYDDDRGHLRQISNGVTTDYYYDYNLNELLVVSPEMYQCQVQQLSTARYTFLLGDANGHIFSPAAALRFNPQSGSEVYLGKTSVRGILVNQWVSCLHWTNPDTSMQVTWSFLDNLAWTASASVVNVPVLCHVTGNVSLPNGGYRSFEHLYEFVHFYDNIPPASQHAFEVPSGIVCPGRPNTKTMPTLPASMLWTGETANEERKIIAYTQERYSAKDRLVIFQFSGSSAFTGRFGTNPLTVVNDFNTGTEYVLDSERGNCTMSNLTSTPDVQHGSDLVTLRLKSAAAMLNLNGNFTYQGRRTVREMPCDVWIIQKPSVDLLGVPVNATYEWAFTTGGWTYQNKPTASNPVPVHLIYTLDDFGSFEQTVTNVYDYEDSPPDVLDGINLEKCFHIKNTVVFSISLSYQTLLQKFLSQFKSAVRDSITQNVGISPLRVANIQYQAQQQSLAVTLDLLPEAPMHSQVVDPMKMMSLENATQALEQAIKDNKLVIVLSTDSTQPTYISVDPQSFQVMPQTRGGTAATGGHTSTAIRGRRHAVQWGHHPPACSSPTSQGTTPSPPVRPAPDPAANSPSSSFSVHISSDQKLCQQFVSSDDGYSAGAMAGSAVGLGILGAVLGVLTHRFILHRAN